MASPVFVQATTGYGNATLATTHSVPRPTGVVAGNLLIAVIEPTNTDGNAAATITTANWTQFTGSPFTGTNNRLVLYWKIAAAGTDTAGGNISVSGTGGATTDGLFARIFEFSCADGWDSSPVQNIGTAVSGTTTTGAISCPSVTTPKADCLACLAMVLNDDAGNTASATGETGGNWTQAVAEFESASGSGGTIEFQTAAMASAGTISGGTIAYGASGDNYVAVAFALVPARPAISSIDSDNDTVDTRTGVSIVCIGAGASETGSAKVEISNNATYGSGTVVEIDATSWSDTSVTVTLRRESDSAALAGLFTLPLSPAYLWLTDSTGARNATGFQFTLSPAGPTAYAALNTTADIPVNTTKLIRARVENSGSTGATAFRWYYNRNSGGWNQVTTTSSVIKAVAATSFNDGDDVPQVLGGSGTYASNNDAGSEDGTPTLPAGFLASGAIEFVLAFQIVGTDVNDNDTILLRIEQADGTDLDTYTQTATLTVDKAAADVTATASPGVVQARGQASTLAASSTFTSSAGSVRAAGSGGSASAGVLCTAGVGSVKIAGIAAILSTSSTASASVGSVKVTGQQAVAGAVFLGTALPGAVLVAGQSATLSTSVSITANVGSVRVAGIAAVVAASSVTTSGVGSVTCAGQAGAASTSSTATAQPGAVRVGGQTAVLAASASAQASAGSIRATGASAALSASSAPQAGAGAVVVSGAPGAFSATGDVVATASPGAIVVSGQLAVVSGGTSVSATAQPAAVLVSGRQGVVATDVVTAAQCGAITARGQAGAISVGSSLAAQPGAVQVGGAASVVSTSIVAAAQFGVITARGQTGAFSAAVDAASVAGNIKITGQSGLFSIIQSMAPISVLDAEGLQDTLSNIPPQRLADIDEPANDDDGEWWTATSPTIDISARVGMAAPQGALVGTQTIRVLVRGTQLPARDVKVELWEDGAKLTSEVTETIIDPADMLSASGPVTVTANNQIVENLDITATGTSSGITVNGFSGVTVRNCRIRYATGQGITASSAPNLTITDVDIATTSAPSIGANPSSGMNCIDASNCDDLRVDRARLRDGSTGIYVHSSDQVHLSNIEGYDFRGPFPRGQLVQFDGCLFPMLEDFSVINRGDIAFTEDCLNCYSCTNITVRRGFISGCNSASGVGVLIENSAGGSGGGTITDVDCVYWSNGAFSATENTQGITFLRCRARDGMDLTPNNSEGELDYQGDAIPDYLTWLGTQTDESRQPPLSGSEAFFAYNCATANIQFDDCAYFTLPSFPDYTPDASLADFTETDFAPRAPIELTMPWEAGGQIVVLQFPASEVTNPANVEVRVLAEAA